MKEVAPPAVPSASPQEGAAGGFAEPAAQRRPGRVSGGARVRTVCAGLWLVGLSACGGGAGPDMAAPAGSARAQVESAAKAAAKPAAVTPATHADAFRLLTQATFGPTDVDVASAMSLGTAGWVDAQLALPSSSAYLARWDAIEQAVIAKNPNSSADQLPVSSQFFQEAIASPDQLRQRVAFALSQIFVVSTQGLPGDRARAVASYMDMLGNDAFGNYRSLLQDVTLHPAMGIYLSSLGNVKENPATGQEPDQNYAREVMQLMSIGLNQLNPDGSLQVGANGQPIPTYGPSDIIGLAKVFTGFSYAGPDTSNARFFGNLAVQVPNRWSLPMQAYPQFHSTSAKTFLGVTIPAQGNAPNPALSLQIALDTLYKHPNVGPFIGRQLIQRLVTSQPSAAYVGRVAAVFNNDGTGVRGNLKAVVRAILLDDEARNPVTAAASGYGKVREPLLRVTAWMRAFHAKSNSGAALVASTDDPGLQLGQTAARSPSVFNFYQPGYIAPGTQTGALGMTEPELQITDETSVAGYVNTMASAVQLGFGLYGMNGTGTGRDVQPDYTAALAQAANSSNLVNLVTLALIGDGVSASCKASVLAGVNSIVVPAATNSNQAKVTAALKNRVWAAILLTLASPEFIVQK